MNLIGYFDTQYLKYRIMSISESAHKLRDLIEKAIEDHIITPEEYDEILFLAEEDGHIDNHERALLRTLQEMIEDKSVRFAKTNK